MCELYELNLILTPEELGELQDLVKWTGSLRKAIDTAIPQNLGEKPE